MTSYPIDMVLVVVFCCLIYSYKNRIQEIIQNNKWLIDLHHHQQQQHRRRHNDQHHQSSSSLAAAADLSIRFFLKKPTCIPLIKIVANRTQKQIS